MFLLSRAVANIRSCTARLGSVRTDSTSLRTLRHSAPRTLRRWSEEEKATVANLSRAKWSTDDIAEQIGRSWSAVHNELRRLRQQGMLSHQKGARSPSYTPEDDSRLLAARREGLSWHEISELFVNRTPEALRTRHKRVFNIRFKSSTSPTHPEIADTAETCAQFYTEEDDTRMLHLRVHEKLTFAQTAYIMGRSYDSLRSRWQSLPRSRRLSKDPPYIAAASEEYKELRRSGSLPEWFKFHGMRALWTDPQKFKLLSMKARGHSFDEIAEKLSLSRAAVKCKYYRLLKQGPRATHTEKAEATEGEPAVLKQEQSSEQRLQLRHSRAGS